MEWIGVPWTDQEMHQLMCDAVYWNSIPRAPFWFMCSLPPHIETHMLTHVITADLQLHAIGENNPVPNTCAKASTTRKGAKKVSVESHDFIMAEIFRREALEDVDSADNTEASGVSSSSCAVVMLMKTAAAVIVNKLTIPLICEHLSFCEQQHVIILASSD